MSSSMPETHDLSACDCDRDCVNVCHGSMPAVRVTWSVVESVLGLGLRAPCPVSPDPTPVEDLNTTLLRRVLFPAKRVPGGCGGDPVPGPACPTSNMRWMRPVFGPIYWASDMVRPNSAMLSLILTRFLPRFLSCSARTVMDHLFWELTSTSCRSVVPLLGPDLP